MLETKSLPINPSDEVTPLNLENGQTGQLNGRSVQLMDCLRDPHSLATMTRIALPCLPIGGAMIVLGRVFDSKILGVGYPIFLVGTFLTFTIVPNVLCSRRPDMLKDFASALVKC